MPTLLAGATKVQVQGCGHFNAPAHRLMDLAPPTPLAVPSFSLRSLPALTFFPVPIHYISFPFRRAAVSPRAIFVSLRGAPPHPILSGHAASLANRKQAKGVVKCSPIRRQNSSKQNNEGPRTPRPYWSVVGLRAVCCGRCAKHVNENCPSGNHDQKKTLVGVRSWFAQETNQQKDHNTRLL